MRKFIAAVIIALSLARAAASASPAIASSAVPGTFHYWHPAGLADGSTLYHC
jgi:hypothetical protein